MPDDQGIQVLGSTSVLQYGIAGCNARPNKWPGDIRRMIKELCSHNFRGCSSNEVLTNENLAFGWTTPSHMGGMWPVFLDGAWRLDTTISRRFKIRGSDSLGYRDDQPPRAGHITSATPGKGVEILSSCTQVAVYVLHQARWFEKTRGNARKPKMSKLCTGGRI
jgi:hypothetical protein